LNSSSQSLPLSATTSSSPIPRRATETPHNLLKEELSYGLPSPKSVCNERDVMSIHAENNVPSDRLPAIKDRRTPITKAIKLVPITENQTFGPLSPSHSHRTSQV
jgi:hypothetical protein